MAAENAENLAFGRLLSGASAAYFTISRVLRTGRGFPPQFWAENARAPELRLLFFDSANWADQAEKGKGARAPTRTPFD